MPHGLYCEMVNMVAKSTKTERLTPGRVKLKTMELVFVVSLLSTQR